MCEEGIKGFFKGNLVNLVLSVFGKVFDFFAYSTYKNMFIRGESRESTNVEWFLVGLFVGMMLDILLYLFEVIFMRLLINIKVYVNLFVVVVAVVR